MAQDDWHLHETYKSLLSISDAAFKYLAVLNGGTWLAALTFAADLKLASNKCLISTGISLFVVSLALTGICYLFSYLTQLALYNEEMKKLDERWERSWLPNHRCFLNAAIFIYVVAVALYAYGAYQIKSAFFP